MFCTVEPLKFNILATSAYVLFSLQMPNHKKNINGGMGQINSGRGEQFGFVHTKTPADCDR